jgi:prevent-host-death family protein
MKTVNIHAPKTNLSRLVEEAAEGKPFIIARAGKPMVKVVPLDAPTEKKVQRLGFLKGQIKVPDDFNTMLSDETENMFYGEDE